MTKLDAIKLVQDLMAGIAAMEMRPEKARHYPVCAMRSVMVPVDEGQPYDNKLLFVIEEVPKVPGLYD